MVKMLFADVIVLVGENWENVYNRFDEWRLALEKKEVDKTMRVMIINRNIVGLKVYIFKVRVLCIKIMMVLMRI